ncbi:MAG: hypothetical protein L0216_14875 [Planctomycetales bacterium]|nr:hypothetical protein [Planctomycetales bacterium]
MHRMLTGLGFVAGSAIAGAVLAQEPPAPPEPPALPRISDRAGGAEEAIERKLAATRVDMDFADAQISQVVDYLRHVTGLNILVSRGAAEKAQPVSLRVKDLPVRDALKMLCEFQGLDYRVRDGVVVIGAAGRDEQDDEAVKLAERIRKLRGAIEEAARAGRRDKAEVHEEEVRELAAALKERLGRLRKEGREEVLRHVEEILGAGGKGERGRGEPRKGERDRPTDERDEAMAEAKRLRKIAEKLAEEGKEDRARATLERAEQLEVRAKEGRREKDRGADAGRERIEDALHQVEKQLEKARREGAERDVAELERHAEELRAHARELEAGRARHQAERAQDMARRALEDFRGAQRDRPPRPPEPPRTPEGDRHRAERHDQAHGERPDMAQREHLERIMGEIREMRGELEEIRDLLRRVLEEREGAREGRRR